MRCRQQQQQESLVIEPKQKLIDLAESEHTMSDDGVMDIEFDALELY